MKGYWATLQVREKRILITGAAVLLLMGLYTLVWEPYQAALERTRAGIESKQATLVWMRSAAEQVETLRTSSGASSGRGDESLLSLVDGSARSHDLGGMLKRVQPDGSDGVRVWLEDAPFDTSLQWIGELNSKQGLRIEGLVVERTDKPGHANLRIVLEEGA